MTNAATLPDFIIIGAMKCGTSTLAAQLAAQGQIFMTNPKEPNYFSDDAVFGQGPEWYADLFATAPPGALCGEASTHYTKLPSYPQTVARMQAAFSTPPRLIYMIRNPLARAVSHYIHEWSEARAATDADTAFHADPTIESYGCYGQQIVPYIDAFGQQNIHLTSLEQFRADPQRTLSEIGDFLDRPISFISDLEAQNVSAARVRPLPLHGLLVENPLARSLRRALVPKALRTRIRTARSMTERPDIPQAVQDSLRKAFLADRTRLSAYFPDHPALLLCYPFALDESVA